MQKYKNMKKQGNLTPPPKVNNPIIKDLNDSEVDTNFKKNLKEQ
jgi:hypothetical protein